MSHANPSPRWLHEDSEHRYERALGLDRLEAAKELDGISRKLDVALNLDPIGGVPHPLVYRVKLREEHEAARRTQKEKGRWPR